MSIGELGNVKPVEDKAAFAVVTTMRSNGVVDPLLRLTHAESPNASENAKIVVATSGEDGVNSLPLGTLKIEDGQLEVQATPLFAEKPELFAIVVQATLEEFHEEQVTVDRESNLPGNIFQLAGATAVQGGDLVFFAQAA